MSVPRNPDVSIKLVGKSQYVQVNRHLAYRIDDVRFPSGLETTYTYTTDDYAAAATVAVDNIDGRRSVFLAKQHRYPSQTIGWEVPAGGPDPEKSETQLQAAKRELYREGGITADLWYQLPQHVENVGRGDSRSDVFIAAGITVVNSVAEADEVITDRRWFDMAEEVPELILAGEISAGHTIACIGMATAFLDRRPDHPISQMVAAG